MDTRAYRIEEIDPQVTYYELDFEEVFQWKNNVLAEERPRCKRECIAGDLSIVDWTQLLLEKGFDPSLRTVFITEGLLMYLGTGVDFNPKSNSNSNQEEYDKIVHELFSKVGRLMKGKGKKGCVLCGDLPTHGWATSLFLEKTREFLVDGKD